MDTVSNRLSYCFSIALACMALTVQSAWAQAGPAPAEEANTAAPDSTRTVEITSDKIAMGQRLYTLCAPCHGSGDSEKQAKKKTPRAALLTSKTFLAAADDEMLIAAIRDGRPGTAMAGWGPGDDRYEILTRDQIESIIAFLRALNQTKPAKLNEAELKGNAKKGKGIFMRSCALCHQKGAPAWRDWGTAIGYTTYMEQVSNGFLREIIARGVSGTAMKGFQAGLPLPEMNLNDKQIDDVIAYLRKAAKKPNER